MIDSKTQDAVILATLNHIRDNLPSHVADSIAELVEHDEAGVALEILCSQIFEHGIVLPEGYKKQLRLIAGMLGIPLVDLDGFAD